MNAPLDPLTMAHAKMASMALALARVRPIVRNEIDYPFPYASTEHIEHCRSLLAEVDKALDGTIYSFTPNGARR